MPLKTETIEFDDIHIVVSEANVVMGTRRGVKRGEALQQDIPDETPDVWLLRVITYPDLMAATVDIQGVEWPLSFEQFCELPERLVDQWSNVVYQLNPHWSPTAKNE